MARTLVDLAAMAGWSIAAALAALLGAPTWVTIPLGLPLVVALPGLALLAMSHPDPGSKARRSLAWPDRLVLGHALSLAVTLVAGLTLHSVAEISAATMAVTLAAVTLLFTVMAGIVRLAEGQPEEPARRVPAQRGWMEWTSLALVAALVLGVGVLAVDLADETVAKPFTLLAFMEPAGLVCHPLEWREGALRHSSAAPSCPAQANLTVGVGNHEGRTMTYRLEAAWAGGPQATPATAQAPFLAEEFTLEPAPGKDTGFQARFGLNVPPPPVQGLVYIVVFLFEGDEPQPMRSLQVRVQA